MEEGVVVVEGVGQRDKARVGNKCKGPSFLRMKSVMSRVLLIAEQEVKLIAAVQNQSLLYVKVPLCPKGKSKVVAKGDVVMEQGVVREEGEGEEPILQNLSRAVIARVVVVVIRL